MHEPGVPVGDHPGVPDDTPEQAASKRAEKGKSKGRASPEEASTAGPSSEGTSLAGATKGPTQVHISNELPPTAELFVEHVTRAALSRQLLRLTHIHVMPMSLCTHN